jgi:hypothetical protein
MAKGQTELMIVARSLLIGSGVLPHVDVGATRALFDAVFVGLDTVEARHRYRRLAAAAHPDSGGDQRVSPS